MPVDLRTRKLAEIVVKYSVVVKPNEKVIISGGTEALDFIIELYKQVILAGGHPIVSVNLPNVTDFFYKYTKKHQLDFFPDYWFNTVKECQCYIRVNSEANTRELTNSDPKKIRDREKKLHIISDYIVNTRDKIRRVTVGYPCLALAQDAEMSLTEYENFVYNACLIDWKKFGKKLDKISSVFEKGKNVHLIGDGVDLKFSIKGKNSVADKGEENMPGGEIFMAPVRKSLDGWIKFDYPRIVSGKQIAEVYFKFLNGKIIEFDCEKGKEFLGELLKSDENASYIGEFGIGCNPRINRYTNDLLFDEKISGTIHLALGMAYKQNGGGNDSSIHIDVVKDMKKAKIVLDGKIVQENGVWKI
ncbi:MAG: aminopeptidase [Nanoarchaeota archaeon]|nr:aminopeptidase [Nanoarchaeota archaeon]